MFGNWQRGSGPNRQRIDVDKDDDVRYWTQRLGVTEGELRMAIEFAGDSPERVREYLERRQQVHV